MKHYILSAFVQYLKNFKIIYNIQRVSNNTIKIEFDNRKVFYFDMSKSNSYIYKKDIKEKSEKNFNAPFDIVLQKKFNNAKIIDVYLRNNDKILNIIVNNKSSYKEEVNVLQFEFTGKNTNIIILTKSDIILEALRHIDEWRSKRIIKVGIKLLELEQPKYIFEQKEIQNIEKYLLSVYLQKEIRELKNSKKQKIIQLQKQIQKIQKLLDRLENIKILKDKITLFSTRATKIISKLHELKGYEKQVNLKHSNNLFRDIKKAKAKINNQHIEQTNLLQKLAFYKRLIKTIEYADNCDEVELYLPKKNKNQIKTKKTNPYHTFIINGYKVMLGRDERENIYLLKHSRASDFWFHLQGQVSSHVIVSNRKKTIPKYIIEESAKMCARFSSDNLGMFRVDYTQRRNVKIQSKANVLYNPYNTIVIKI
jgi:predicted ribosome quality control (RQC) complex YloA/Tae2 family protein